MIVAAGSGGAGRLKKSRGCNRRAFAGGLPGGRAGRRGLPAVVLFFVGRRSCRPMAVAREVIPKAAVVSSCTLASRALGLVRDVLTSSAFGTSWQMDLFIIVFMIPNLFRKLLGEGALSSAFIPVLSREIADPEKDESRLLRAVLTALAALLGGLVFAGWAVCAGFVLWADLSERGYLFFLLLAIMLPYMALICMTALLGAALNVRRHFFAPAIAPAALNICWIAAVWWFSPRFGVRALAWGVLAAGLLQFALQLPFIRRSGWGLRPLWDLAHPGLRRVMGLVIPVIVGLGVFQVNVVLDQVIAKFCVPGDGANSALYFGNRLIQFPLGVLGIALATAVFPLLARSAAEGKNELFVRTTNLALRAALFIALPCMAVALALSAPMVRVVFERNRFSPESTVRTARVLFYYAFGLWAFCGAHVLTRAFHALEDMRTPVKVATLMVGLNLALNLTLVWFMAEAGLALASAVSATGTLAALFILLRRRLGPLGGRALAGGLCRALVAAGAGGGAGWWMGALMRRGLGIDAGGPAAAMPQVIALAAAMVVALAVFGVVAWLLRARELNEFADALRRRRSLAREP